MSPGEYCQWEIVILILCPRIWWKVHHASAVMGLFCSSPQNPWLACRWLESPARAFPSLRLPNPFEITSLPTATCNTGTGDRNIGVPGGADLCQQTPTSQGMANERVPEGRPVNRREC